jgi:ADP-heptose:LPS heptosyltransferase
LLVRLSAMGDLVQTLGAVRALRRCRPGWLPTLATQAEFVPLVERIDGLQVVPFDRRGGLGAVIRLRRALRERAFDVALDLQGNWKSATVAWVSGARERIGAAAAWRQEPASRVLLRRVVEVPGANHPALVAWTLVRELVGEAPFLRPRLDADAAEVASEERAVRALGIEPKAPFRVVVVSDPRDPRALRPSFVAREVATGRMPAIALMGPAESALPEVAGLPTLRHAAGELRRLIALGAIVARSGGDVVGPDQGPVHVLSAAGATCRVLFGPQDPRRTAPPSAAPLVSAVGPPCRPCSSRRCTHASGPVCMDFASAEGRVAATDLPPLAD